MRFQDKIVIITGGAQGIGKEIAVQFVKEKAKVIIFDVNEEKLSLVSQELGALSASGSGSGVTIAKVDITNLGEVEKNINKIIDNFGRVDILVNNAGITKDNLILRLSESDWDTVYQVNLKGSFNCIKGLAKHMVKQRYGKIVNISSIIGIMGNIGQANYAASKAGLIGLTRSLAKELGSRNVNVNAVAPGYIKTAMTDELDEKVKEAMLGKIPLSRFGQPGDVAQAVLFLASDDANYITRQVIVVDGGLF